MTAIMWRETPFSCYEKKYRYQTNISKINKKMRNRKDFKLITVSLDKNLWVYTTTRHTLKDAIKTFHSITKQPIQFDKENNIYYSHEKK